MARFGPCKCKMKHTTKQGVRVTHCGLAIYIKKYLNAKEERWKFKHFTMQKYNLFKKSSKRNQNPSRYHNSITNFQFQHKPKISSFKNPHIKIDLVLPRGQKSIKLLYSIMNLNTISLPCSGLYSRLTFSVLTECWYSLGTPGSKHQTSRKLNKLT